MSYYCPQCGTEVSQGNQCPECGHIDEQCSSCGTSVAEEAWLCENCETPSSYCPECGGRINGDTCRECGATRPAMCASCGGAVDADATECAACGYNPGAKYQKRAKWTKYIMYIVAAFTVLSTAVALVPVLSAGAPGTLAGAAVLGGLLQAVILVGPLYLLTRRWSKKGNQSVAKMS